jgi:hypothetical protein
MSFLVDNLDSAQDYQFVVVASNSFGESEGEAESGTTSPDQPQNLKVESYTSTTVLLSWTQGQRVLDYQVF